jgi:hypothetical protein
VYWKGLELSELLEYDSRLVAFMQELPFQKGKPLSPIFEEGKCSIELLEYGHTVDNSPDHQVYMASLRNADDDEPGPEYDTERLVDMSTDERTMDAPKDENKEHKRIRRLKNAKHAQRRQNAANCACNPMHQRNLNSTFAAATDREYRTPIWRHCRSSAPSSTITTQPLNTKAAVSNPACARATRWATPNVLYSEHAL